MGDGGRGHRTLTVSSFRPYDSENSPQCWVSCSLLGFAVFIRCYDIRMQDGACLCQNPDQNPDQHSGRADLWEHDVFTVDEAVLDVCPLVLPLTNPH